MSNFTVSFVVFLSCLRNLCPKPERYCPIFARNFTTLSFRSAVHLELICVWWYMEVRVPFFSVCNEISYASSTVFLRPSFPVTLQCHFCHTSSNYVYMQIGFWTLYSAPFLYIILCQHHTILTLVQLYNILLSGSPCPLFLFSLSWLFLVISIFIKTLE